MRRFVVAVLVVLAAAAPIAGAANADHGPSPLPTVSAGFDHSPTIVFPKTAAPKTLSEKVLEAGTGPVITTGELLVMNYVGQIWRGKVFDSSFDRPIPSAFQIGTGEVIPGLDRTLVGLHVGSRVLLVVPPADGYGAKGDSSAGITGKDTIVFVVDLLAAYGPKVSGDRHAVVLRTGSGGVHVSGVPPTPPKITIAKGTPKPSRVTTTVLDRGHSAKAQPGLVILQAVAVNWTGKVIDSTWAARVPAEAPIGIKGEASLLDPLIGTPLGSRVLIVGTSASTGGPYAVVVDLVAEPKGTPAQSK